MLEAAGRQALVIDLPGRGDGRPHRDIKLDDFIDYVAATLDEIAEPVILVGHSRTWPHLRIRSVT